jgi:transcriptional regulator with XRE-family HTH domain
MTPTAAPSLSLLLRTGLAARGWSQSDLVAILEDEHDTRVARSTIAAWLRGHVPSPRRLNALALALEWTSEDVRCALVGSGYACLDTPQEITE